MIREEARNILESLSSDLWRELHPSQRDALDMAIEALQENESLAKSVNEASELLRKKRPHGEWIYDEKSNAYRCSNCRHFPSRVITEKDDAIFADFSRSDSYIFCPHCGSDNGKISTSLGGQYFVRYDLECCPHKWKPYKEGTVICELCGKFAKVGFMERR